MEHEVNSAHEADAQRDEFISLLLAHPELRPKVREILENAVSSSQQEGGKPNV